MKEKSFIKLALGAHVIKTFFVCDLRIFVPSKSVCNTRLEKLALGKHSSLFKKFVNNRQKSFMKMTPGANVIKLFCW